LGQKLCKNSPKITQFYIENDNFLIIFPFLGFSKKKICQKKFTADDVTYILTGFVKSKEKYNGPNLSMKEGSLFVLFLTLRSHNTWHFLLCSWYGWRALDD
jgi:hypothetical protein